MPPSIAPISRLSSPKRAMVTISGLKKSLRLTQRFPHTGLLGGGTEGETVVISRGAAGFPSNQQSAAAAKGCEWIQ